MVTRQLQIMLETVRVSAQAEEQTDASPLIPLLKTVMFVTVYTRGFYEDLLALYREATLFTDSATLMAPCKHSLVPVDVLRHYLAKQGE